MSHSLHRYGTEENLQNDWTFYARTSRWVNREGCGPKLRKILDIILSEKPVNLGSSHAGKSVKAGLDPKEYAATLAIGLTCVICKYKLHIWHRFIYLRYRLDLL